jgi:hypothetical protein
MTQGPAMSANGRPLPIDMSRSVTAATGQATDSVAAGLATPAILCR